VPPGGRVGVAVAVGLGVAVGEGGKQQEVPHILPTQQVPPGASLV